jgi:hypothetical protein
MRLDAPIMAEGERRRQRAGGEAACGVRPALVARPRFRCLVCKASDHRFIRDRDAPRRPQAACRIPPQPSAALTHHPAGHRLPSPSCRASLLPMPLFRVFRTPPQWLRAMLLVMALGFALNSIAHASHSHDVTGAAAQHLSCGYCAHLGALADGPKHADGVAPLSSSERLEAQAHTALRSRAPELSAQPRAPPSL